MTVAPRTAPPARSGLGVALATAGVVLALYALSGVYVVGANERGVVTRFGRIVADDVAPGARYHAPWPFERARSCLRRVVDTAAPGGVVAGGGDSRAHRIEFLTGDRSLVEAGAVIEYEVSDPAALLGLAADPSLVVRRVAESALSDAIGRATLDDVLSERVTSVETDAASRAQARLDALRSGVRLTSLGVEGPSPAGLAAAAHGLSDDAAARRERVVRDAQGYRGRITALARSEAGALLAAANEHRARAVGRAEAEAARFTALLTEYRTDQAAVRDRLYRETMREVLRRVRTRVLDVPAPESPGEAAGGPAR